ncbi:xanthomonadin biosynthesis 3-hydroxybenozate--AMP ligase XanA2 [Craurococcus roseus]|uniref:Xanthomonadin biosynthesis 3-hydroxybenozate--AMP ligase XanA2 n=1 Tax=Craurococcus roseus TaxID=77585 RepID=A0ABN1ER10_9PROT
MAPPADARGAAAAIPLTARPPSDVLCWRGGRPVSVGRFLRDAAALAARLSERPYAVNFCADRYLALVAFAAALSRGQTTLLCADRSPLRLRALAARYPDAHALADGPPLEGAAWPVTRPDAPPPGADAPEAAAPLIPAGHVAAIAFTSGSTGEPEAHAKPWGALVAGAEAAAERFGLRAADGPPAAIVATVPPQHMYGFETTLMLPLHSAAAQVAGETFYPSDVAEALAAVPARRVLVTTPLQLRALLADVPTPAPLAAVVSATAPLSTALAEAVEGAWGAPVLEIYGATEAGSMASRRTVLDPDWLPYRVVSLHPGGVSVEGLGPVPLADALDACTDPLRAGRFRLLGRQSDVVKLGGRRASLAELNRVLLGVEGVEDGAFLAPDDLESNPASRLSAFVVAPTRTPGAIIGELRGRMEPVFLPRPVVMVPALPRDRLGKLPRRALLELRRAAATATAGSR